MSETNGTVETVVDFSGFAALVTQENAVVLSIPIENAHNIDFSVMQAAIDSRIMEGKKPAGTLVKTLGRITHHVEQLRDAVTVLYDTYGRMVGTVARKRSSAAFMARQTLLESMSDKMLRLFASEHIGDDAENYILPDDRAELIFAVCTALAATVDNEEKETVGNTSE